MVQSQRNAAHCGDQTAFAKIMKDGFTTEKSPQPITNCRFCILLPKNLCSSLIMLVAAAANLPHQLAGLLKRDVVLPGEVVNVIGGVRCTPLDAAAQLLPLRHADGFHDNDIATHRYSLGRWLREFYWPWGRV